MKTVIFRKRAERDLLAITSYFAEVAPHAVPNILSDIYRAIDQLAIFPLSGMEVEASAYETRRIVSRKYHFKIIHEVTPDAVNIVGIFRYEDRDM